MHAFGYWMCPPQLSAQAHTTAQRSCTPPIAPVSAPTKEWSRSRFCATLSTNRASRVHKLPCWALFKNNTIAAWNGQLCRPSSWQVAVRRMCVCVCRQSRCLWQLHAGSTGAHKVMDGRVYQLWWCSIKRVGTKSGHPHKLSDSDCMCFCRPKCHSDDKPALPGNSKWERVKVAFRGVAWVRFGILFVTLIAAGYFVCVNINYAWGLIFESIFSTTFRQIIYLTPFFHQFLKLNWYYRISNCNRFHDRSISRSIQIRHNKKQDLVIKLILMGNNIV